MFHTRVKIVLLILMVIIAFIFTHYTTAQSPLAEDPLSRTQLPYLETDGNQTNGASNRAVPQAIIHWSRVVFQSFRDNNWEIYTSNDDGSSLARLTHTGSADLHPRLNRGSNKIVFASNRQGGVFEIYSMNADGTNVAQLTSTGSNNGYPTWSPNGTQIAFESYRDGQAEIYVMNADGSNQTRLTNNGAFDGMPAWSPDGSKIAFSSRRTGDYRIWVMNANGSSQTQLSTQSSSLYPAWSPDGSKIAYSADEYNQGWLSVYTMSANGSDQIRLFTPGYQKDAWVRSWSPDGRYVVYTLISFTQYQGNWYWVDAYLDAVTVNTPWAAIRLSQSGLDWHPDWQTTDGIKPTSTMVALPSTTASPFTVRWSGNDTGGSGFKAFDVQIQENFGPWTDWLTGVTHTSDIYPGIGGRHYAFRVRASDNAYNVQEWPIGPQATTTVEALPPQSSLFPMAPFTRADSFVSVAWQGTDPGGSGIASFDLQYRLNNGAWTNWLTQTTLSKSLLASGGTAGDVVGLRLRARDNAQNLESWPDTASVTTTTLYHWGITGLVHDNTGTPISGALAQTWPMALNEDGSRDGVFGRFVASASPVYSVTLTKPGYGLQPVTAYLPRHDVVLNVSLPPADNLVADPHFESPSFSPHWLSGGNLPPTLSSNNHTGQSAALMGQHGVELAPTSLVGNGLSQTLLEPDNTLHLVGLTGETLWHRQRLPDGTWSSTSSTPAGGGVYSFAATLDEAGNVHVARSQDDFYGVIVYIASWHKATNSWSNSVRLSEDNYWAYYPQLTVDGRGQVHVVWQNQLPGNYWTSLIYTFRNTQGVWSAPMLIEDDFGHAMEPQIGRDENDNIHLVWYATAAYDSSKIRYTQRSQTGEWQEIEDVAGPGNIPGYMLFALEPNGATHIAWSEYSIDHSLDFFHRSRNSKGEWTAPWRIFSNWVNAPDLAISKEGIAHLVWLSEGTIYHAQQNRDGGWYTAVPIGDAPTYPQVALDTAGNAHVVWGGGLHFDQPQGDVFYTRQWTDGSWSISVNLSPGGVRPRMASIVSDASSSPHVFWTEGDEMTPSVRYRGPQLNSQEKNSTLQTVFTISPEIDTPVLSYHFFTGGLLPGGASLLRVGLDDGNGVVTLNEHNHSSAGWQHSWADLTAWAGQTVTVTFSLHQAINTPVAWAFLDDVTVGTAYPDVWVAVEGGKGLRGEQIVHTLTYGNRGGAMASGTRLTYTLPAELVYVSASYAPVSTSPLVWELPALPAKSSPFTLSVVVQVAPTAVSFSTLLSTAVIQSAGPELETHNNSAQGQTFIGRYAYLPLLFK